MIQIQLCPHLETLDLIESISYTIEKGKFEAQNCLASLSFVLFPLLATNQKEITQLVTRTVLHSHSNAPTAIKQELTLSRDKSNTQTRTLGFTGLFTCTIER